MTDHPQSKNKYFDPKPPPVPEEVFGMSSNLLIELGRAASGIYSETPRYIPGFYRATYQLEDKLRLLPLLERVRAGEDIKPEDVRPYRHSLKNSIPRLGTISAWTAVSSGLLVGIPARRILNRKIEEEFPKRAPELLQKAARKAEAYLPLIDDEVEFIAGFKNPREQFTSEIGLIAGGVSQVAKARATNRRHRNEVTADDIGHAVKQTLEGILADKYSSKQEYPMLWRAGLGKLKAESLPPANRISIVAPEIISAFMAALPQNNQALKDLYYGAQRYPSGLRGLAKLKKGRLFESLETDLPTAIKDIRGLLPTTGSELRQRFAMFKNFVKPKA